METNKNNFFQKNPSFVPIFAVFCLFIFGTPVFGQKTNSKKPSVSKTQTNEKQRKSEQTSYWNETRKSDSPRKLALLVGISDYSNCKPEKDKPCWWNLNGKTDVLELSKSLRKNYDFEIVELTDNQATKEGIRKAFEKLVSLTQEGDIVYFHFSGHGTNPPDQPNGDELDGRDEAIVPFDYGYMKNYDGLIIDDQINIWLNALKNKKPSSVTITFDSCNSGTATRGGLSRGATWSGTIVNQTNQVSEKSPSGLVENGQSPNTGFVYISAAGADESAKETVQEPKMGEFTKALIKTLEEAKPNTTYREAFEKIKDIVTRNQTQNPRIEGDWDNQLLGNSVIPTESYFTIKPEGNNFMIQAGKLHGMRVGSKFAIYEAGTKRIGEESKKLLTNAEIIQTFSLTSAIKFEKPIKDSELIGARAFETGRQLDIEALKVVVNDLPEQDRKIIGEVVKSYEFAEPLTRGGNANRNFDLLFRTRNPKTDADIKAVEGNIVMERSNGSVKVFSSSGEKLRDEIKKVLEQEVRWKTVKELENENSDLKVEMRVVPVNIKIDPATGLRGEKDFGDRIDSVIGSSGLELSLGDYYRIEVKNNSPFPVYVTILSLSEGKVGPNFPNSRTPKIEDVNKIMNDGQWKPVSVSRVTLQLGIDSYKLIATKDQADFSSLIDESLASRGTRGEDNARRLPIGKLFRNLSRGTRDETVEPAPPESWTTTTISYLTKCSTVNGLERCCQDRTQRPWMPMECKK